MQLLLLTRSAGEGGEDGEPLNALPQVRFHVLRLRARAGADEAIEDGREWGEGLWVGETRER